ncbi:MAG: hypothetical protein IT291_05530 [Deltaproteobacteria bacterium]|nr:hypothetical protein [Deltaproteobacteria bacterium]
MGYGNLVSNIAKLKRQVNELPEGQISFFRALCYSLTVFIGLAYLLPVRPEVHVSPEDRGRSEDLSSDEHEDLTYDRDRHNLGLPSLEIEDSSSGSKSKDDSVDNWFQELEALAGERMQWLENSIFGKTAANRYLNFVSFIVDVSFDRENPREIGFFSRFFAESLIRIGFVVLSFWPLWLFVSVASYVAAPILFKRKPAEDVLGICDPGVTPFYSGIYGALQPNNSISGTDFSCPGLACPNMIKRHLAVNHVLCKRLQSMSLLNDTNAALVSIILAYRDFPALVVDERSGEERSVDDVFEQASGVGGEGKTSDQKGIIQNSEWNLEASAVRGLEAVIDAHSVLVRAKTFFNSGSLEHSAGASLVEYRRVLESLVETANPLAKALLFSLTYDRARALAEFSMAAVVTAFLAIEAGKSLVFQKRKDSFAQISFFPHLQARAVLHSVASFHKEYSGDTKLNLRQAILSSRRHGDFGRAFLPVNMSVGSRALRDWLEILYAPPEEQEEAAYLVELDAHIEEIHLIWRQGLGERLAQESKSRKELSHQNARLGCDVCKGVPFKSVVLMPIASVIQLAMQGVDADRQARILQLAELSCKRQSRLSVSARLPGFKRQSDDLRVELANVGGVVNVLASSPAAELVDKWLIVRRMLTRYNWLSTRIGDESVPADGLVQAIVVMRMPEGALEVAGLDALVPLRQRRFKMLFGEMWEKKFYLDAPHPDDVEIFTDVESFNRVLAERLLRCGGSASATLSEKVKGVGGAAVS